MLALSLPQRVLLVCALLALASGIEVARRGRAAWRPKGSLILIACALLGAGFGALVDAVDARISPDYFVHGKGLARGVGLRAEALALGAEAGLCAGVLIGSCFVLCARPRADVPALPLACVARCAARALVYATCGWGLGLASGFFWVPVECLGGYAVLIDASSARIAFLGVWCAHFGLYLGVFLGVLRAAWDMRRVRASAAPRFTGVPVSGSH